MVTQAMTTDTAEGSTESSSFSTTASATEQYHTAVDISTENGSGETEITIGIVISTKPPETSVSGTTVSSSATVSTDAMDNTTVTDDTAPNSTVTNTSVANTTIAGATAINTTATTTQHTTNTAFTPTTLLGNTTFTPDSRNGSTPTIRLTAAVQVNQTGSTTTRDSNSTVVPTRRRTTATTISSISTAPVEIYTSSPSQTTWTGTSTALQTTTAAPQHLTSTNLYIGGGAAIIAVVLITIVASISWGRRRKHSKCRKLGDDEDTINAYDVELATTLGEDNIGTSAMILDTIADDRPEIRNYFQDGLLSEGNDGASTGDAETQNGLAAPSGGITVEDRLGVGPIMMNDGASSTQDTSYGRAYSSHNTFNSL